MKVKSLSLVRLFVTLRTVLFVTPQTVAYQASLSMGFSRQEFWSGLPFPSPGDLPNPGIEPGSPSLEADALTSEPPGEALPKLNKIKVPLGFAAFLVLITRKFWFKALEIKVFLNPEDLRSSHYMPGSPMWTSC